MKVGFDAKKYLEEQSKYILERVNHYDKLYLEFGGKLLGDYHAKRVLPGFDEDAKIKLLHKLKDKVEIIICVYAGDIERNKIRGDFGITYDMDVMRLIDDLRAWELEVNSIVITRYDNQPAAQVFINKLERENSCFETVVEQMREKYGTGIVPLQLPMGKEADFVGMIDLLNEKAYKFEEGKSVEIPIPEEFMEDYESQRTYLIEVAAESCDELLLKYLEGEIPTNKEIRSALRMGIANGEIFPVVGGSVAKNMGLDVMMDVLVDLLPVPTVNAQAPASAIVFKTLADPFVGKLSFLKVIDGQFNAGDGIYNVNNDVEEKVGSFIIPCGKQQSTVTTVNAGDIVAIAKLQNTQTSNTLTVKGQSVPELAPIKFPAPNLTFALSPKSRDDDDKMSNALGRLLEEDPTLTLEKNAETHETLLSGVGETHLEVVAERFKNKFGVDVVLKPAQIPYRETIKNKVEVQGKHKKQSGGHGQYGDVWIEFEPTESEEMVFEEAVFGGSVPRNFFPAVEKGLREACKVGMLAGYPMVGVLGRLVDGSYHPVDSSEMAFKMAASLAYKAGIPKADPTILEPVGTLVARMPDDNLGDIMGDITKRRGRVLGMGPADEPKMQELTAEVPMAEMGDFTTVLRSVTAGRGSFSFEFTRYEQAPQNVVEKVIAEAKIDEE